MTEVAVTSLKVPAPDDGERNHMTPLLLGSPLTVAVKSCVLPACTIAEVGEREMAIAGTVIVAELDFDGSAAEVTVRVTATSLAGGLAGAL